MGAPTGLYGWIRSNDGRSTGLFVLFLLAIQLIAPLALVVPLIVLDPGHAPFAGWGGYLLRYAPLVLIASVAWFAAQLWWHVETVKRAVGFRFIDADDEPRLCRVIEPLVILTGLPVPFVGVIESDARNAFACGIGRKKAVVVVTRGLIDALTDAELGAVLAHELSHIKNGDIRLMAAANIFMMALSRLHARNALRFSPVHGLLTIAVPALLPLTVVASLIGRLALRAGQVSRLLIASSREFIADAQAAQWTQDPGALAAALLKVDGRHRIEHARAEDDAMMIAGDSEGASATHPPVAQRVAALARVTGSMVWNAPHAPREDDWTAATPRAAVERLARGRRSLAAGAITRVRRGDENVLGLTRWGTLALVMSAGALVGIHWDRLNDGRAMAATFDPRPVADVVGTAGACELGPFFPTFHARCEAGTARGSLRAFEGQEGTLGGWLATVGRTRRERGTHGDGSLIDSLAGSPDRQLRLSYHGQSGRLSVPGVLMTQDGRFVSAAGEAGKDPPDTLVVAETDQVGCFVAEPRPAERDAPLALDSLEVQGRTMADVRRQAADLDRAAAAGAPDLATLTRYLTGRQDLVDVTFSIYGQAGLDAVQAAFAPGQAAAVSVLREALYRPDVIAGLQPVDQANLRALVRDPAAFVPCRSIGKRR